MYGKIYQKRKTIDYQKPNILVELIHKVLGGKNAILTKQSKEKIHINGIFLEILTLQETWFSINFNTPDVLHA